MKRGNQWASWQVCGPARSSHRLREQAPSQEQGQVQEQADRARGCANSTIRIHSRHVVNKRHLRLRPRHRARRQPPTSLVATKVSPMSLCSPSVVKPMMLSALTSSMPSALAMRSESVFLPASSTVRFCWF